MNYKLVCTILALSLICFISCDRPRCTNENLIFVAQYNKSGAAAIIALDDQYRCRLAITPTSSNQILGLDTGTNSDGDLTRCFFTHSTCWEDE